MKNLLTLLALFVCISIFSQEIKLNTPLLSTSLESTEKPIYISAVDKTVRIIDNFASTTIEYTIYNPNQRTMEASFDFSLADGQYISGFALDLDGEWRDGVPVEKAKGQQVFESVIRQNIDPALLEKTIGNNYRVRVYPLLGNQNRKVKIVYDQELGVDQGLSSLSIPVSCTDSLQKYSLTIEVQGDKTPLLNQNIIPNLTFRKSGNGYVSSLNLSNQHVDSSINVIISKTIKDETQDIFIKKCSSSNEFIFYTRIFSNITFTEKSKPQSIDLYWDISASAKNRDINKELSFLNDYISYLQTVDINLYTFNINLSSSQRFPIKDGNWNTLKQYLEKQIYDGPSQLGNIDLTQSKATEVLIFSDGISNFGNSLIATNKASKPIIFISSSPKANYTYMKYWCNKTKGQLINLLEENNIQALNSLTTPNLQFASANYNTSQVKDVSVNKIMGGDGFSITGKLLKPKADIELKFGSNKEVLFAKKITIDSNQSKDYNDLLDKIWAERQINDLSLQFNDYRAQIASLAQKFDIVTDNMSLIVLDRIEDYVAYRINTS